MYKFMTQIFPPAKIAQLVQEINTLRQFEGENLAKAWERFHVLPRRFPHHRLTRWMQVHTFYNDLSDLARTIIDASAGGALMKNTIDQALMGHLGFLDEPYLEPVGYARLFSQWKSGNLCQVLLLSHPGIQ